MLLGLGWRAEGGGFEGGKVTGKEVLALSTIPGKSGVSGSCLEPPGYAAAP